MNISIFYSLHSFAFQYQWLDGLVWFLAVPFIYIVIISVGVYLFYKYKVLNVKNVGNLIEGKGREIVSIFFSTGLAYALAYILKLIIHTDRPAIFLSNVSTLFAESGYAFPSGHSATIAALAFAVYFRHKRLGYLCMLAGLLIGLARVVAGVHFPIDIIGGYALGFLVAYLLKTR
ncbi:MAG: phosphatase PAP2 family protein [Patescibacteria group bacterium]